MRSLALALCLAAAPLAVRAEPAATRPATPPSPPAADLSWLAGSWHGGNATETWDATFTSAAGGVVLGTYKQAKRSGTLTFVELQQFDLRQSPATLTLFANGGSPYRLRAKHLTPTHAEFEGEHAFPRNVALHLDRDGHHTLTLTGTLSGRPFQERFAFAR